MAAALAAALSDGALGVGTADAVAAPVVGIGVAVAVRTGDVVDTVLTDGEPDAE